ncbi:MAG: sugar phosphate isomerase/epimerase family protein [Candidatus Thorarchaeota archaeon]
MVPFGASYFSGCTIPFEEFLSFCTELKMDYVEIQSEPPFMRSDMTTKDIELLQESLASFNITPTIHAPMDDVNLSSLKERIRRVSLDLHKESIDLANDLGASIVVIHAGVCPVDQLARLEDAQNRFRASLLELAYHAEPHGIIVGVENKQKTIDREIMLYPEEHISIVEEYRDLGVRGVLDIGHANTVTADFEKYIQGFGDLLTEVHLHDNDGIVDSHLSLGQGTIDFSEIWKSLRSISFKGPSILELKTKQHLQESMKFIMDSFQVS